MLTSKTVATVTFPFLPHNSLLIIRVLQSFRQTRIITVQLNVLKLEVLCKIQDGDRNILDYQEDALNRITIRRFKHNFTHRP